MNVGSLFTGVGGFDLGLERAGHTIAFQCEADAKCRQVLRRHWPEVPIYEDVREVAQGSEQGRQRQVDRERNFSDPQSDGPRSHGESEHASSPTTKLGSVGFPEPRGEQGGFNDGTEYGNGDGPGGNHLSINLLCGGFPCQDLSVAGKRAGLAGERSGLFFEATRIADALLGDGGWLLIENVPGLLSSQSGRDFGIVLSTLAELGFYDLAWRVLDSRYFGVPQRRRRVFVLARRARGRRAAEVLLEPESGGGDFTKGGKARAGTTSPPGQRITNALDGQQGGPDDNSAQANHLVAPAVTSKWRKGSGGPAGDECQNLVSGPLTRRYGKGINTTLDDGAIVCSSPNPDGVRETSGIPGRVDGAVTYACQLANSKSNGLGITNDGAYTLDRGGNQAVVAFHATQTPISSNDHSPALGSNAQIGVSGNGITGDRSALDPKPDGPRYAQMGNAVTVQVAEWIGYRLAQFGGEE